MPRQQPGKKGNARVYTPSTPMPWGYYKGTPLEDLPAWYLLHLWETLPGDTISQQALLAYIRPRLGQIKKQC